MNNLNYADNLLDLCWDGNLPVDLNRMINELVLYKQSIPYKLKLNYDTRQSLSIELNELNWIIKINPDEIIYRQRYNLGYALIWLADNKFKETRLVKDSFPLDHLSNEVLDLIIPKV